MHKAKDQSPLGKVALVLAFSLWMSSASGQATYFGSPDCGEWIAEKSPTWRAWLVGYLSGMNAMYEATGGKPKNPLGKLNSVDQAYLWMDNWCRANPLQQVHEGSQFLFVELMKKK